VLSCGLRVEGRGLIEGWLRVVGCGLRKEGLGGEH
jgi:hypothetical protein